MLTHQSQMLNLWRLLKLLEGWSALQRQHDASQLQGMSAAADTGKPLHTCDVRV